MLAAGAAMAATLAVLLLLSGRGGGPGEGLPQVLPEDSLPPADSPPDSAAPPADSDRGLPEAWPQARGGQGGNAAWEYAVLPPFDTLWTVESSGEREFFSSPALVDGVLYLGCNDGYMRAIEAATGRVLWSHATLCGICGEPAVDSSRVYFGGQDGTVYCLDREDGSLVWSSGLGYHVFCDAGLFGDSLVVTGNSMGKVCALDRDTGEPVWSGETGGVVLGPAVSDSLVVVTTENGRVAALGPDGGRAWTRDFGYQASPPTLMDEWVYAGFSDGFIRRLSLDSGETSWETDLAPSGRCVVSRPVLAGELLLAGTCDDRVVCLQSSTGELLWERRMQNWVQVAPAALDTCVYVSCDDMRLHVLSAVTGESLDSLETGGYAGTAPLLAGGVLYLGGTDGELRALRGTRELPPAPDSTETAETDAVEEASP